MGIHCGLIGVTRPWPDVAAALATEHVVLVDPRPVAQEQWGRPSDSDLDVLFVAEHQNQTHILDPGMVLASSPDLFVRLSAALECVTAAAIGESISETYALIVADGGHLRRNFFDVGTQFAEPLSQGAPLPSEASVPLQERNGRGLAECFSELGFDVPTLFGASGGSSLRWDYTGLPAKGPATEAIRAHAAKFPSTVDEMLKDITAVTVPAPHGNPVAAQQPKRRRFIRRS